MLPDISEHPETKVIRGHLGVTETAEKNRARSVASGQTVGIRVMHGSGTEADKTKTKRTLTRGKAGRQACPEEA